MHELSVCLSLIEEVKRVARQNDAGKVTRIIVKVGPLSGVEPDLLQNAYPLAAAGTVAEKAELEIELSDIVVSCSQCGGESPATANKPHYFNITASRGFIQVSDLLADRRRILRCRREPAALRPLR